MNHQCVKCKATYQSDDVDAYLCLSCTEAKKAIAAQIDAQFANRPRSEPTSELRQFEASSTTRMVDGRQVTIGRA